MLAKAICPTALMTATATHAVLVNWPTIMQFRCCPAGLGGQEGRLPLLLLVLWPWQFLGPIKVGNVLACECQQKPGAIVQRLLLPQLPQQLP